MGKVESKLEIERKFLVEEADLSTAEGVILVDIESIYLDMDKLSEVDKTLIDEKGRPREIRVTKEVTDGLTEYWSISKVGEHALTREEATVKIDKADFEKAATKFGKSRITKKRFKFKYNRNTFEIDVFPEDSLLLMEVELKNEGQIFELPPFVLISREVTGEEAYYNANMAKPLDEIV
jgi:CYTH domain-containing protein